LGKVFSATTWIFFMVEPSFISKKENPPFESLLVRIHPIRVTSDPKSRESIRCAISFRFIIFSDIFFVTIQPRRHEVTNYNFQFSIICVLVAKSLRFFFGFSHKVVNPLFHNEILFRSISDRCFHSPYPSSCEKQFPDPRDPFHKAVLHLNLPQLFSH